MIATAITGDDSSIIIAFGIAPVENFEYWKFFIAGLNSSFNLNNVNNLVILSDREKGLSLAISELIPNAFHSYCVSYRKKHKK